MRFNITLEEARVIISALKESAQMDESVAETSWHLVRLLEAVAGVAEAAQELVRIQIGD